MQEENESHFDTSTKDTNCILNCCSCLFAIFPPCHEDIVILLLGLDKAGKSTLISTIRREIRHNKIPTWGFDEKKWITRHFRASVYDLGGGKSIRGIWPHYYAEAHGAIFVVDGADDVRLLEASTELRNAIKHPRLVGKPFLIVGNNLNDPMALQHDELLDAFGPLDSNKQAFVYCDCRLQSRGTISKDLQLGLDWLLASIKFCFNELQERVAFESAKQRDEEQQSLIERRLRSKYFTEEKMASSQLQPIVLPNLKDIESEFHAHIQTWIGPDGSNPVICSYENRTPDGKSFNISMSDFDKSLQCLVKQYEDLSKEEPSYSPNEIVAYFGNSVDKDNNIGQLPPHLPGQPSLTTS